MLNCILCGLQGEKKTSQFIKKASNKGINKNNLNVPFLNNGDL